MSLICSAIRALRPSCSLRGKPLGLTRLKTLRLRSHTIARRKSPWEAEEKSSKDIEITTKSKGWFVLFFYFFYFFVQQHRNPIRWNGQEDAFTRPQRSTSCHHWCVERRKWKQPRRRSSSRIQRVATMHLGKEAPGNSYIHWYDNPNFDTLFSITVLAKIFEQR